MVLLQPMVHRKGMVRTIASWIVNSRNVHLIRLISFEFGQGCGNAGIFIGNVLSPRDRQPPFVGAEFGFLVASGLLLLQAWTALDLTLRVCSPGGQTTAPTLGKYFLKWTDSRMA